MGVDDRLWMIALRREPAMRKREQPNLGRRVGDARDLAHRRVLFVFALDGRQRTADRRQAAGDVPVSKLGHQPGLAPGTKDRLGLVMVTGEASPPIAAGKQPGGA